VLATAIRPVVDRGEDAVEQPFKAGARLPAVLLGVDRGTADAVEVARIRAVQQQLDADESGGERDHGRGGDEQLRQGLAQAG